MTPQSERYFGRALAVVLAAFLIPGPVRAQMGGPAPVAVAPVVERQIATGKSFVGTVQPVAHAITAALLPGAGARLLVARAVLGVDALEQRRPGAQQRAAVIRPKAMDPSDLVGAPQALTAR